MSDFKDSQEEFDSIPVGSVFEWHNGRTYIKISATNAAMMFSEEDLEDMKEVIPLQ